MPRTSRLIYLILFCISVHLGYSQSSEWINFKSPEGDYSILFPEQPSANHQNIDSDIGELKMNIFMYQANDSNADDNILYGITSTAFPKDYLVDPTEDELKEFFRGSIDGAVNNVQGKLISEKIVTFEGYPGREFKIDYRDGLAFIFMRAYLVENTMYMLQTITVPSKDSNKSIYRFMDSFSLNH